MFIGRFPLRAITLACLAALATLALSASNAWAEASTTCVKATKVTPPKPAKKHYTGGWTNSACTAVSPTHEGKYEKITQSSFSESEEQQLKALLKYVKVQAAGVAGKPTVQVAGANLQVVNGAGKTRTKNGAGNLIIGYDENPGSSEQTGSHDLILGEEQTFSSYGGIAAGYRNQITAPFASVSGGVVNQASGEFSSVSGGAGNVASGFEASASGGEGNTASGLAASVSGGYKNTATGGDWASVSGGEYNTAGGRNASWIGGGYSNQIANEGTFGKEGEAAAIFGGKEKKTSTDFEALPEGNPFTAGQSTLLKQVLPHMAFAAEGIDKKPTVQYTGANVQIVNGGGKTATTNGTGNLAIGYDENPGAHQQTGSHDLILGEEQTFSSYGGIDAGGSNEITAPFASVSGGQKNAASGEYTAVSGGKENTAGAGRYASVSGGQANKAKGESASVTGGEINNAVGGFASVSGGLENTASGPNTAVSGGGVNVASGNNTWVGGGANNTASNEYTSVSGGSKNTASGSAASVSGGVANKAESKYSSVSGGGGNAAGGLEGSWIGGGQGNKVTTEGAAKKEGLWAAIFGGNGLSTNEDFATIP